MLYGDVIMRYFTISVPEDVKRRLEKAKGKRQWGEFLLALYEEAQRLRSERTFRELSDDARKRIFETYVTRVGNSGRVSN